MKPAVFLPVAAIFFFASCSQNQPPQEVSDAVYRWTIDSVTTDFAKYVDPMIGTAGHGHTFPGATAPFGMVQLSPDTRADDSWDGCSGYHYSDSVIYGFSHTHLSGTGCSDYGDILVVPGSGDVVWNNGGDGKPGYGAHFSHKNEYAEAGYYAVTLDNSIKAELTSSPRVGVHRYSFPNGKDNWLLFDLVHRDEVLDSKLEIVNDHTIRGYRFSKAWAQDQRLWFYAEFSEPFESMPMKKGATADSGKVVKWTFKFPAGKTVTLKVALSPVSWDNAKLNMETEVPGWNFDEVRAKVRDQWNQELGKIEVKDSDETNKRIFYTALYHCFVAPNLYCDVNGDYMGMDHKPHNDPKHPQYTVFSLWDTYRALHPLFTIVQPKRNQDFINTFLKQYKEGGRLPVWELSANETNCMIGYHSVPVIVDAWMKGETDFDTALAYEAMRSGAMADRRDLDKYKKFGYIPADGNSESVSQTLEYAYDDWCIAQAAKRMKKDDDYVYFMRRAQSWRNLFDPQTDFMRARFNNSFAPGFVPEEVNFHYTEANAWQYNFAVQQDVPALIYGMGGEEKFRDHLEDLFAASSKTSGRDQADISGMIGQYAQGNEPSHHMAYLFAYADAPYMTQYYVHRVCKEMYTDKPDGLCGNEDCGQMSAWYVLSALGFYEVTPGTDQYVIGSPLFKEVVLHLENGKTTTLSKEGMDRAICVQSVNINGKDSKQGWLTFSDLTNGPRIEFNMVNGDPGFPWTTLSTSQHKLHGVIAPEHYVSIAPYAPSDSQELLTAPIIQNSPGKAFTNSFKVDFETNCSDPKISYTINNGPVQQYTGPFEIRDNAEIKSWAACGPLSSQVYYGPSDTSFASFTKSPGWKIVSIKNPYANQYSAGGKNALVDGIHGGESFRTGEWQGYEGTDLDVVIDLGASKMISGISAGFLQDQGAWIFMPDEVDFYISADGKNFTQYDTQKNSTDPKHDGAVVAQFSSAKPQQARYVRIVAKNRGVCPDWHPGKGNKAWIFADEIQIETNAVAKK